MRSTRPFAAVRSLALLAALAGVAGCQLFRRDPVDTPPAAPLCAPAQPYFEFQVETPARFLADSVTLATGTAYPSHAAPRGSDSVTVQFVVGVDGRPEAGTLKVLRANQPELMAETTLNFERWRYTPARLGRCAVRQLVQTNVARYGR